MTARPVYDGLLFHYLLGGAARHATLRPLSDFPESQRWQAVQREVPGHYEILYRAWAEPVLLRRPRLEIPLESLWRAADIERWFGRDRTRLFFHVPQVVTYQPGGVPVPAGHGS